MLEAIHQFRQGRDAIGTAPVSPTPKAQIRAFAGMVAKGQEWRHLDMAAEQEKHWNNTDES